MKSSIIRYRVADFLRAHPPFDLFSLEDLLAFSGSGRVVFHEDDVYLYQKGEARDSRLWVIQQGRIEIVEETPRGSRLRDVLGPGDILGLDELGDAALHAHAARTATEVILYSFEAESFRTLAGKYPAAGRYLTAHATASARQTKNLLAPANRERLLTEREKASWLHRATALPAAMQMRFERCRPEQELFRAAALLRDSRGRTLVVMNDANQPMGCLSERDLSEENSGTVAQRMNRAIQTAAPRQTMAAYWQQMLQSRSSLLVITRDGSQSSPVEGVLTEADLAIHCGRNPMLLLREMGAAESIEELAYLVERLRAFLVEELAGPLLVEWFWRMARESLVVLLERLTDFAKREAGVPDTPFCWLLFGAAGRGEYLFTCPLSLGLVYEETSEAAPSWFAHLARAIEAGLSACGIALAAPLRCQSRTAWEAYYAALIRNPIENDIYRERESFDLQAVAGDLGLCDRLCERIHAELAQSESFLPILANDTLAELPPLTFFQGFVIETDGGRKTTLNLQKTAIDPIADAARVFALAQASSNQSDTIGRLRAAIQDAPLQASVFQDAADGLRIASYQHAIASFAQPQGEAPIHPALLGRVEQRLLKTAFDAVRRLLELTERRFVGVKETEGVSV